MLLALAEVSLAADCTGSLWAGWGAFSCRWHLQYALLARGWHISYNPASMLCRCQHHSRRVMCPEGRAGVAGGSWAPVVPQPAIKKHLKDPCTGPCKQLKQHAVLLPAPQQTGNVPSGTRLRGWWQLGSCSASASHQKASKGPLHRPLQAVKAALVLAQAATG